VSEASSHDFDAHGSQRSAHRFDQGLAENRGIQRSPLFATRKQLSSNSKNTLFGGYVSYCNPSYLASLCSVAGLSAVLLARIDVTG
jgi:hypothetical protein